jgi:hypothetical protein
VERIEPEPAPEEREAIAAALAPEQDERSEWTAAALREAVAVPDEALPPL